MQLPFPNHLLDNAKRSYTEKHPLGRDKEQLGRLRSDIGTASERAERVLEYSVSCDSALFTTPAAVTLRSIAPQQSAAQGATAGSSPAVTRVSSPVQGARNAGALQQQQQHGSVNVLKLGLKPVGPGVYPAKLVLTSAYDVRHIELQVTAQARGQACVLELECPARQQVSRGETVSSRLGLSLSLLVGGDLAAAAGQLSWTCPRLQAVLCFVSGCACCRCCRSCRC